MRNYTAFLPAAWSVLLLGFTTIMLPHQVLGQCGSAVAGTNGNPFPLTIGQESQCAANSLPVPAPTAAMQSNVTPLGCGATQQREVWFIFTATADVTVINLYQNNLANMGFMVYEAPCANAMTLVGCAGYDFPANQAVIRGAFNTVPGNQYYVRVTRRNSNTFTSGLFNDVNNLRICGWSWTRPEDEPACEASFEDGTTNGWTCRYGNYNFNWNFTNTGCLNAAGPDAPLTPGNGVEQAINGGNRHTIISDKLYLDPRTNFNVPGVAPKGGNFSFRLGNNDWGCGAPASGGGIFNPATCPPQAESVSFPLLVTEDNAGFTYMFAVVLLNPSHAAAEQPRFEVSVTTPSGVVDCGYFLFVAGSGLANFQNGPGDWQYTNWTEVGLDFSDYIGQTVTIEFRVAGCYPAQPFGGNNAGNHSAYVYIDAYCKPLITESPTFCAGDDVIEICAPSGFVNYQWPPQPGLQPPLNQQCVTVVNPVAGTEYTVNMELITGCPTSTTVVLSGIPVSVTEDQTICAGQTIDLEVSVLDEDEDPPYTFEWSHGPTGPGPHPVSPLETTTYTVVTTGASGCGSTAEITVEVENCAHVVTATGGSTCPGGCVELSTSIVNDLFPPYTYTWTGGVPDGPGPYEVCPDETTVYTVTVTDANGQVATAQVTAEVLPIPQLDFEVTDASCNGGEDGSATAIASGATGPYTYVWDTAPPQEGATATGLVPGTTYTVTSTDANGCENAATVSVGEPSPITLEFTTEPANCGEADGTATVTPAGGTGPYTYAWQTVPVQNTATATNVTSGVQTVVVTDANGCTATGTTVVSTIGGAELSTTHTDASCFGVADGTATVTALDGVEPYTYAWSTVPVQNTATATGLAAGTYTITVTEANGCIGTAEVVVGQPTLIVPSTTTTVGICGQPNATATATATGGVGPYTFVWNTNPPQEAGTATDLAAGNYTVTVTDATGCSVTTTALVAVEPGPVASFTVQDVCLGSAANFVNTSVNGSAWAWTMGDGTSYAQQNVTHTYAAVGTYTVELVVSDANGCVSSFSADVTVNPIPSAEFAAAPLEGCAPVTTTFENLAPVPGSTCVWQFGDGSTATDCASTTHTYPVSGCYDVTLTVSAAGCTSQFTVNDLVCVSPVPVVNFMITPNPVSTNTPVVTYLDLTTGATDLLWTFEGGDPASSTSRNPVVNYAFQEPGEYLTCLVASNPAGCVDSLCKVLTIQDELTVHVPNAFTPDGDGVNDVFLPVLLGHRSDNYRLLIFNRWGEFVFETNDPTRGWDGTAGGTLAQDGVYVWKLRVSGEKNAELRDLTGHVTLLR